MRRICAWCKVDLGTVASDLLSEDVITHGICSDCADKLLCPQGDTLLDFLDTLQMPVVVVDSRVEVKGANKPATTMLQKELPEVVGFLGGNVFECAFATLPGGCGKTVHCAACTIRNTVTETFRSGRSHLMVPAYLNFGSYGSSQTVRLTISTEKINDLVLLRIDKVTDQA